LSTPAGDVPAPVERPEPGRLLGQRARAYWTLSGLAMWLPLIPIAVAVGGSLEDEDGVVGILATVGPFAVAAVALWRVAVVPSLRWRRWRWELRDEELDLRHGLVTEVRTIVPISRVQHVEVRRTPLASALGLSEVVVHTAAGTTDVPAMDERAAVAVRDRIADLARVPDDL
jgi:membrane protein YdbS with pleckstrin-like domain